MSLVLRIVIFISFCWILFVQPAFLYVSLCEQFGAILALIISGTIAEAIYFASPERSFRDVLLSKWVLLRIMILIAPSALQLFSQLSLGAVEVRNLSEDQPFGVSDKLSSSDYRIEVCCVPLQQWNKARQESQPSIADDYNDSDIDSASPASGSAYRNELNGESSLGIIFASHYGEVIASVVDGDKVALTAILHMHINNTHGDKGATSTPRIATHDVTLAQAAYSWSFSERRYFHYQMIRKAITGVRFSNAPPDSQLSDPLTIKHSFGLFGPLTAYVLKLARDI